MLLPTSSRWSTTATFAELRESEIYGLIASVIILILAFGSVLAMGLPIGTALCGLGVASPGWLETSPAPTG